MTLIHCENKALKDQSQEDDPFDPNTWLLGTHEHRVYGDDMAQTWAVVDEVDYQWAVQWRWVWKVSRGGLKKYLRRTPSQWMNGVRIGAPSIYLHVEIMKRTLITPPSPFHVLVDHIDGNSDNNRRSNLRWATHSQNRRNINGSANNLVGWNTNSLGTDLFGHPLGVS